MIEPVWMQVARRYTGIREIAGPKHNSTILGWLDKLGAWWRDDETPWCGVFVAHCLQSVCRPYPSLYMRAKAWADYGSLLRPDRLAPGAILVFDRAGGGHVAFYVGEDATDYHVLGGNQSNGVNIMRLAKSRCIATRWPKNDPVIGGPVRLTANSTPLSRNEA